MPLSKGFEQVHGWLDYTDAEILYKYASIAPTSQFIEVGSFMGRSAVVIAQVAKERNGHLICIDKFPDQYANFNIFNAFEMFRRNMVDNGVNDYVTAIRGNFENVLPLIDARAGFIYIDGDHSVEGVIREAHFAMRCIVPGGYIVFHDYINNEEKYKCVHATIDVLAPQFNLVRLAVGANAIAFKVPDKK